MEIAGQFGIFSPQHEDLFSLGSLTPNPFYVIYRHEISKILRELANKGAKVETFDVRGKIVILHTDLVQVM